MTDPYSILFSDEFLKELKNLKKKYRRVDEDVYELADLLKAGTILGDRLQGTGDYIVYKVRLASRDMKRGKSGGFRIIYYLQTETQIIVITIYAKTAREDISSSQVVELIEETLFSLEDDGDDDLNEDS